MTKGIYTHIKFIGRDMFDKEIGQRYWVSVGGGGEYWMNVKDGKPGDCSFKQESVLYHQIFEFLDIEGHL